MNEGQKRSTPGFHDGHSTIFSQHAMHFGKGLLQIAGQIWQMMQTALHDEHIFGMFPERKFPAIGNDAFCEALILRNKPGREVYPFEVCESETLQCDQAATAPAKKLDDVCIAWPLAGSQTVEAADKLSNFL